MYDDIEHINKLYDIFKLMEYKVKNNDPSQIYIKHIKILYLMYIKHKKTQKSLNDKLKKFEFFFIKKHMNFFDCENAYVNLQTHEQLNYQYDVIPYFIMGTRKCTLIILLILLKSSDLDQYTQYFE